MDVFMFSLFGLTRCTAPTGKPWPHQVVSGAGGAAQASGRSRGTSAAVLSQLQPDPKSILEKP